MINWIELNPENVPLFEILLLACELKNGEKTAFSGVYTSRSDDEKEASLELLCGDADLLKITHYAFMNEITVPQ